MSQVRQQQGTIVRFWALDHHRAEPVLWTPSPWVKLVFAAEGTLQMRTENQMHVLPPNRAMVVGPGKHHPARTLGRARLRTLYFAESLPVRRTGQVLEVRPLFRELVQEACRIGPLRAEDAVHLALARLILSEVAASPVLPASIRMPESDWLLAWAEGFLASPREPSDPGFSRRTLERRLLAETGLTLGEWCRQARALLGLQALSRGATVLEAALEAGFETSSGFIQSFKRQFGQTPGSLARTP